MKVHHTSGADIEQIAESGWRLSIPAGAAGKYRLARLDDYTHLKRKDFLWRPPLKMHLKARVSADNLPGTWGFGIWNDPFSFGLGLQGMMRHFPTLTDAAWFFHGSEQNYLAFSDNHPARGLLAAVFTSSPLPGTITAAGLALAPFLALHFTARWIRGSVSKLVKEDSAQLTINPKDWHDYAISWELERVTYSIDQNKIFETIGSPSRNLGMVVWIDNQFASFSPRGEVRSGTLANSQVSWLEIKGIEVTPSIT